ncbi:hypothetical protein F5Y08DRAFT_90060 [Xylaria arbuscula]|nr:hypothetical protein F5Y08DRAFT_90060 [Xylaria arbuscula]
MALLRRSETRRDKTKETEETVRHLSLLLRPVYVWLQHGLLKCVISCMVFAYRLPCHRLSMSSQLFRFMRGHLISFYSRFLTLFTLFVVSD